MALDLTAFQVRFPEFANIDAETDALATAKLAEAEGMTDRNLFKDPEQKNADTCVGYLAAYLLANSPGGLNARLDATKIDNLYWKPYKRLLRSAVFLKQRTT